MEAMLKAWVILVERQECQVWQAWALYKNLQSNLHQWPPVYKDCFFVSLENGFSLKHVLKEPVYKTTCLQRPLFVFPLGGRYRQVDCIIIIIIVFQRCFSWAHPPAECGALSRRDARPTSLLISHINQGEASGLFTGENRRRKKA